MNKKSDVTDSNMKKVNTTDSNIKNNAKDKQVVKVELFKKYCGKLCNNNEYFGSKLFICLILSSLLSVSTMFSFMKVSFSYRDETIVDMKSQLDEYKGKVQSISTTLDTVTNDLENIKNDIKNNKESSSNSLVRLANLLKDVQIIKNALNISNDSQPNTKEEDLNSLPSDKREFIESFENLIKDGVPFSDFIEKIDTTKYKSIKELLAFKDKNVKSIESLKKDFTAIASSVFGNQGQESFWQKQFRIFKEKISNAIRVESSNGKIQTLGNNLDNKGLFEKAQSCINNNRVEEACELINKIKLDKENITMLKSDLLNRTALNKAFAKFKTEFIKMETSKQ